MSVVVGLVFVGRDFSDGGVEPLVVVSVDPFRGGEFDVGEAMRGFAGLDQFRNRKNKGSGGGRLVSYDTELSSSSSSRTLFRRAAFSASSGAGG